MANARIRINEGIDGRDSVGLYLEAIAKFPLLSAEEEVELGKKIEAGLYAEQLLAGKQSSNIDASEAELREIIAEGQDAYDRFVNANLRLVVSVARKFGRTQMPLLDLIQEGNTGLIRAVEKFDYLKGFKFSTYATWWIRQAITRGLAQQSRIVRLPVHVAEQVTQVSVTRRNLERVYGREPEISEIAKELELDENKIHDLLLLAKEYISLDAPVDSDGDTALGDLLIVPDNGAPETEVVNNDTSKKLEEMLNHLDERSADVVRRRYGLLDGRAAKLADIGEIWGITAERVRQIERSALKELRDKYDIGK